MAGDTARFKPGVHYGVIPVDAQTTSKPTLLKAGAEMICLLFGWRARFGADLPVLQMYGPGITGAFALVCELIDLTGSGIKRWSMNDLSVVDCPCLPSARFVLRR